MSMFHQFENYVGKYRKASTLKRSNSCNTIGLHTFKRFVAMQDLLKNRVKTKANAALKAQHGKHQLKPKVNQKASR